MKRAIHLYPDFGIETAIRRFREKNDPLAAMIPPHITLVFPFDDPMPDESLINWVHQVAQQHRPITANFSAPIDNGGEQVWLEVTKGYEDITALHKALYADHLQSYLRTDPLYTPHVTLGSSLGGIENLHETLTATRFESKPFYLDRIIVESIRDTDQASIILGTLALTSSA